MTFGFVLKFVPLGRIIIFLISSPDFDLHKAKGSALPGGLVMVDGGGPAVLLALLVVLSLVLEWVCVLGGLVGVVSLRRALWVFGGVQVCKWLLGLGFVNGGECGLVVVRVWVWV